jgi:hypothetical protein
MDANESMHKNRSQIAKLAEQCNLIDIHTFHHQRDGSEPPASHKSGSEKIDHCLVSPGIAKETDRCGIDAFSAIF